MTSTAAERTGCRHHTKGQTFKLFNYVQENYAKDAENDRHFAFVATGALGFDVNPGQVSDARRELNIESAWKPKTKERTEARELTELKTRFAEIEAKLAAHIQSADAAQAGYEAAIKRLEAAVRFLSPKALPDQLRAIGIVNGARQ